MRPAVLLALLIVPLPARAATVLDLKPEKGWDRIVLDVGGFLQPKFSWSPTDEGAGSAGTFGFGVRRARLETSAAFIRNIDDKTQFAIRPKFSVEFAPEPSLKDVFVDLSIGTPFHIRVGQHKFPTNRAILCSETKTLFNERAFWTSVLPERDIGVMVGGSILRNFLEYDFAFGNGEGVNQPSNVNRKFLIAGRVAISPLGGPGAGDELLAHSGDPWKPDPDKQLWVPSLTAGYSIHHNVKGPVGQEEALIGHNIEFWLHWRWITLQAEWFYKLTDFEAQSIADSHATGFYAQLGSFIPMVPWAQDHVALLFRLEQGDTFVPDPGFDVPLNGPTDPSQAVRRITFGAGFYAGKPLFKGIGDLRVTLTYSVKQELEGQNYDNDELLLAIHMGI